MHEDIDHIDWGAIRDMVKAPEPAPEPAKAPRPKVSRTAYWRAYARRRRGSTRTYATWPDDYPEHKREELRRAARERGVPVAVLQREWGVWG
jgi:hypothetical protein